MKQFTEDFFLHEGNIFYTGAVQFINIYNYNMMSKLEDLYMLKQCKATVSYMMKMNNKDYSRPSFDNKVKSRV